MCRSCEGDQDQHMLEQREKGGYFETETGMTHLELVCYFLVAVGLASFSASRRSRVCSETKLSSAGRSKPAYGRAKPD